MMLFSTKLGIEALKDFLTDVLPLMNSSEVYTKRHAEMLNFFNRLTKEVFTEHPQNIQITVTEYHPLPANKK